MLAGLVCPQTALTAPRKHVKVELARLGLHYNQGSPMLAIAYKQTKAISLPLQSISPQWLSNHRPASQHTYASVRPDTWATH